jgi:hypothetical protein
MAGKNETSVGVKLYADSTGFEKVFSQATKTVLGLSVGLNQFTELGKKGWEGYKKIMESTEGTAETLQQQVAYLDGAMGGLIRTVASQGLISGFGSYIKNMALSAEATRDMTAATQEYEHAMAGASIKRGRISLAFQEARVSAGESENPEEKARYLQEAIDLRKELTTVEVEEVAKRLKITEDYYKKITGHGKDYFDYFMQQVPKLAQEYEYYFGSQSVVLEGTKKRIADLNYREAATVDGLTEAQKSERHELQLLVYVLEDYVAIQDDFSKKGQWDEFIRGIGDMSFTAAAGEKALARLVKQLLTAKGKIEDSAPVLKRVIGPERAKLSRTPQFGKDSEKGLQADMIPQMTGDLGVAMTAVNELSGAFETLFLNVGGGFRGMVNAMLDSLKLLFAQLIGKAALFGLLQVLFPGSGMAVGALSNLRKFIGIPGFASGTNYAPGGLSLVGERGPELINLPRGSQVIPMKGGGERLVAKLRGRDVDIVLERYYKGLNAAT